MQKISLAIHGGAGTILKEDMTPELEAAYLQGLESALAAGYKVLEQGGSAVDAVETAVILLEDNLLFNAGRGAVFTNQGKHEMDASIMDGKNLSAGAVAAISNIKNPVRLASEIMRNSNHIFFMRTGSYGFCVATRLYNRAE